MKIYYFTRLKMLAAGIILILIGVSLGIILTCYNNAITASKTAEPIYQGDTGKKVVAITVNVDWGEEFIPGMLEQLKKNNARVTFFVTGVWAQKHPELLKQMYKEGHSIQNHGYKHINFNSLSAVETGKEVKKAEDIIYDITGHKTSYFAPPSGAFNQEVARGTGDINYKLIMWSVDTIDWQRPSPNTIVDRVMKKVHNDAIILMHPTEPTLKALPDMLKQLTEEEYKMVTIDRILAAAPGKKTNNVEKQ